MMNRKVSLCFLLFFLLVLSMDAMLRLSISSNLSFSKIVIFLSFFYAAVISPVRSIAYFLFVASVILYSSLFSFIFNGNMSTNNYLFSLHFIASSACAFYGYLLASKLQKDSLYQLLCQLFFIILASGFIAYVFSFSFPNVIWKEGVVRGWYWNENDMSLVLASIAFFIIYFQEEKSGKFKKATILGSVIAIAMLNGSRVILISLASFFLLYLLYCFLQLLKSRLSERSVNFSFSFLLFLISFSLLLSLYSLNKDELIDPFARFVTLNPYGYEYGSIYNRVDASIFAVKAFFDSYGFGVGLGSTVDIIGNNTYGNLLSASSVHNLFIQLLSELGYFFIAIVFAILFRVKFVTLIVFWCSLVLASVSQSAGIFSNYIFFFIVGCAYFYSINSESHILKLA